LDPVLYTKELVSFERLVYAKFGFRASAQKERAPSCWLNRETRIRVVLLYACAVCEISL
jgi:hypothetical protein